jgi:uncharacterized membrane protein YhaH (DUF805 family)
MDNLRAAFAHFLKAVTEQYWQPNGREGRRAFWSFVQILIGLWLLLGLLSPLPLIGFLFTLAQLALALVLAPPAFGLSIRRVHDVGLGAIHAFIPGWNLVQFLRAGTPGANRYG